MKIPSKDDSLLREEFQEIQNSSSSWRERRVKRYILAVKSLVNEKYDGSWEKAPWVVQFLPLIVEHFWDLHLFQAVNPSLQGFSGLMGTPKHSINERLNQDMRPRNLFFKTVPTLSKIQKQFQKKYSTPVGFPTICKPDVGERATGVTYLYNESQLEKYISTAQPGFHLEEYADTKKEFAISWMRDGKTGKYEIWSVMEKKIPFVTGDGISSLKELIEKKTKELGLAPDRSEKILKGFPPLQLKTIIEKGAEQMIVRTASISYGTSFANHTLSPEQLKQAKSLVDMMIVKNDGLFVGRFDLRSNTLEELLVGKGKIIEMNGIGGMPMEIYEPNLPIEEKYAILSKYFKKVQKVAERNIELGIGKSAGKMTIHRHVAKLLFGKNKTQELPEGVKEDLLQILKMVMSRGRLE